VKDVPKDILEKAAKDLGHELKVELIKRGQIGIMFLSRVYGPDVWYGDTNSCCDLPRQLSKFHVCQPFPPSVTAMEKLVEKAFAYSMSDMNTPIMGPLCQKALRGTKFEFKNLHGVWNIDHDKDDQYPNEHCPWMDEYAHTALPEFDVVSFHQWAEGDQDPLSPPLCMPWKPPAPTNPPVYCQGVMYSDPKNCMSKRPRYRTLRINPELLLTSDRAMFSGSSTQQVEPRIELLEVMTVTDGSLTIQPERRVDNTPGVTTVWDISDPTPHVEVDVWEFPEL
jgi:hypothetical protein